MNNSNVSATSNHTIAFTTNDNLVSQACATPPCLGTTSSTLSITFPAGFNLTNLTCGDINMATGTAFLFNVASPESRTNCLNTGTSWGVAIDAVNNILTFTTPTSAAQYTPVVTGTQLTVSIGSNATFQNQGAHWISNPAAAGTYVVSVGGSFGGTGSMDVAIIPALQLSVSVAETLTFAINGLPGQVFSGSDKMTGCTANGTTDDEDSAAIQTVTTVATSVPFGVLPLTFPVQGCQLLQVSTNAGNGYTIYSAEDHPLKSTGGFVIADTKCNTPCTPTSTASFTNIGFGISCVNSATSATCSTSNPNWSGGTKWAPVSDQSRGLSPAPWSSSQATSVLVSAKAKYRVKINLTNVAGIYTNNVSWIVTPVY